MEKPTISQLFTEASKLLRAEFEFSRVSNPHSATKGGEVENVLRKFLNNHLPQRFHSCSGILIDDENNLSKQTDVIIYDCLCSPVYRYSESIQIIPNDTVATIIEVKTCLSKTELEDAYEKVASCKGLKKSRLSRMDQKVNDTGLATVGTQGVIFGFDSDISLQSLAKNVEGLNRKYPSKLWPDMIVVLDKGIINYGSSFPGEERVADIMPPCDENFFIPPLYFHLMLREDGEFTLNRFFCLLLAHLTFFPRRQNMPPINATLAGSNPMVQTVTIYQYNLKRELKPTPPECYNGGPKPLELHIGNISGRRSGLMQFIPWQDGSLIRWFGRIPFEPLLQLLIPESKNIIITRQPDSGEITNLLTVSEEDFRSWPRILEEKTNLRGEIIDWNKEEYPKTGPLRGE